MAFAYVLRGSDFRFMRHRPAVNSGVVVQYMILAASMRAFRRRSVDFVLAATDRTLRSRPCCGQNRQTKHDQKSDAGECRDD